MGFPVFIGLPLGPDRGQKKKAAESRFPFGPLGRDPRLCRQV